MLLYGAHPGYLLWDRFAANQRRLAKYARAYGPRFAGPRCEGPALLQGMALCERCVQRMTIRQSQRADGPQPEKMYRRGHLRPAPAVLARPSRPARRSPVPACALAESPDGDSLTSESLGPFRFLHEPLRLLVTGATACQTGLVPAGLASALPRQIEIPWPAYPCSVSTERSDESKRFRDRGRREDSRHAGTRGPWTSSCAHMVNSGFNMPSTQRSN